MQLKEVMEILCTWFKLLIFIPFIIVKKDSWTEWHWHIALTPLPVVITSSCSTDDTVVADSDVEMETATSVPIPVTLDATNSAEHKCKEKIEFYPLSSDDQDDKEHITLSKMVSLDSESKGNMSTYLAVEKSNEVGQVPQLKDLRHGEMARGNDYDDSDSKNSDIIYSQDLIIRDISVPEKAHSLVDSTVLNFKRFRKVMIIFLLIFLYVFSCKYDCWLYNFIKRFAASCLCNSYVLFAAWRFLSPPFFPWNQGDNFLCWWNKH